MKHISENGREVISCGVGFCSKRADSHVVTGLVTAAGLRGQRRYVPACRIHQYGTGKWSGLDSRSVMFRLKGIREG